MSKSAIRRKTCSSCGHDYVLTAQQQLVLRLVAQGMTYKEVGHHLSITDRTVKEHVTHITEQLGASNTPHAVAVAMTEGLL